MPNFVKNKIIVNKNELKNIVEKYTEYNKDSKKLEFDFNKVIEMPEDLKVECSTRSENAIRVYMTFVNPFIKYIGDEAEKLERLEYLKLCDRIYEQFVFMDPLVLSMGEILKLKEDDSKNGFNELFKLGKKLVNNIKTYGHTTWYTWARENWGSKWNASETEINTNESYITYETPWSPATNIIIELSKQNPKVKFAFLFADEVVGSNTGYMLLKNGKIDFKGEFEYGSIDAYKLAFDLWKCEKDFVFDEKENKYVLKEDYN